MKDLKAGDRVRLVKTSDPYTNMGAGTLGVLISDPTKSEGLGMVPTRFPGCHAENPDAYECSHSDHDAVVSEYTILSPKWDNGSWLMMIPETGDVIEKVEHDAVCPKCNSTENVTVLDFNSKPEGGWWTCSACEGHKFQHRVVVTVTPIAERKVSV